MASSDVKFIATGGDTGAAGVGRCRIRQIVVDVTATPALVAVNDDVTGKTLFSAALSAVGPFSVNIPGNGVLAENDIYVATALNATLGFFYS